MWIFRTIFNCTEACPREIRITRATGEVKKAILKGSHDIPIRQATSPTTQLCCRDQLWNENRPGREARRFFPDVPGRGASCGPETRRKAKRMDHHELRHLQERYRHLLQLLGHAPADPYQRVIHTHPLHAGYPHVELVDGRYHYVVTERGSELQRRTAKDEDELLYWLISDVTHAISTRLETRRWFRIGDPRRWWFAKDVELLSRLRPEWGKRKRAEYEQVLLRNPYMDKKAGRSWG